MQHIQVSAAEYAGIRSGFAPAIIIDESKDYLVNDKVLISVREQEQESDPPPTAECVINFIHTGKQYKGLQKDYALVFLSVIRLHEAEPVLSVKK